MIIVASVSALVVFTIVYLISEFKLHKMKCDLSSKMIDRSYELTEDFCDLASSFENIKDELDEIKNDLSEISTCLAETGTELAQTAIKQIKINKVNDTYYTNDALVNELKRSIGEKHVSINTTIGKIMGTNSKADQVSS